LLFRKEFSKENKTRRERSFLTDGEVLKLEKGDFFLPKK